MDFFLKKVLHRLHQMVICYVCHLVNRSAQDRLAWAVGQYEEMLRSVGCAVNFCVARVSKRLQKQVRGSFEVLYVMSEAYYDSSA